MTQAREYADFWWTRDAGGTLHIFRGKSSVADVSDCADNEATMHRLAAEVIFDTYGIDIDEAA